MPNLSVSILLATDAIPELLAISGHGCREVPVSFALYRYGFLQVQDQGALADRLEAMDRALSVDVVNFARRVFSVRDTLQPHNCPVDGRRFPVVPDANRSVQDQLAGCRTRMVMYRKRLRAVQSEQDQARVRIFPEYSRIDALTFPGDEPESFLDGATKCLFPGKHFLVCKHSVPELLEPAIIRMDRLPGPASKLFQLYHHRPAADVDAGSLSELNGSLEMNRLILHCPDVLN